MGGDYRRWHSLGAFESAVWGFLPFTRVYDPRVPTSPRITVSVIIASMDDDTAPSNMPFVLRSSDPISTPRYAIHIVRCNLCVFIVFCSFVPWYCATATRKPNTEFTGSPSLILISRLNAIGNTSVSYPSGNRGVYVHDTQQVSDCDMEYNPDHSCIDPSTRPTFRVEQMDETILNSPALNYNDSNFFVISLRSPVQSNKFSRYFISVPLVPSYSDVQL